MKYIYFFIIGVLTNVVGFYVNEKLLTIDMGEFIIPLLIWLAVIILLSIWFKIKKDTKTIMLGSLISFFGLMASFIVFGLALELSTSFEIEISNTDLCEHNITIECGFFKQSYRIEPNSKIKVANLPFNLCFLTLPENITVTLDDRIKEMYEVRAMGLIYVRITNESGLRLDIIQGPVI
jgi:hypothetical protein